MTSVSTPIISVIMPVFNGEKYLGSAVESILNQTLDNFEFIIVNDGSTDETPQILESFRVQDDRISVHHQPKLGFAEALNRGCALAQGKYLARMDADDLSMPQRFERQVEYLQANTKSEVCGSWIRTFGGAKSHIIRYPTSAAEIKCQLLFDCCLAHPSVVMRRELFSQRGLRYDPKFREASDYSLWVDVSKLGCLINIPDVLLSYRVHASQVSERDRQGLQQLAQLVRMRQLEDLGVFAEPKEIELHRALSTNECVADREFVEQSEEWLLKLQSANDKAKKYDSLAFAKVLAEYWFIVCNASSSLGFWTFKKFLRSPLSTNGNSQISRPKLLLRCLAKRDNDRSPRAARAAADALRA